jgi:hypothetical protein
MSLHDVLNDLAEVEHSNFTWDVLSNGVGSIRIEAATPVAYSLRTEAYAEAENLLAALQSEVGARAVNDGMIGAKWDDDEDGGWRGYLDLNFFPPDD